MDKLIVYWYCLRRNLPWKKEEARGETGEMQMVKTKRGLQMGAVDMTQGTPWKQIIRFALPLLLGNLFQQLYNTVDAAVVGNYVGSEALAAVGTSGPVINLLVGLFLGMSLGAGILISQFFGAKAYPSIQRAVNTALLLTLALGLAVSLVGLPLAPQVLKALHAPEHIYPMACSYLQVIFCGVVPMMFYNMVASILRALGDSKTPLIALGIASMINIGLDLFFVIVCDWGVAGVAWATVVAQSISVLFSATKLHRMAEYTRISRDFVHPDVHMLGRMVRLGLPSGIQQTAFSAGMMLVQSAINSFGQYVMAAYVVTMKVDAFCVMPLMSLGLAMTTYTGQNVGAGDMERVDKGCRQGLLLTVSITGFLSLLLFFFGKYPLMLFTPEAELLSEGMHLLRILCPFYWVIAVNDLLSGVMRGSGNTIIPMINSMTCLCLIRIPLMYWLISAMQSADALYYAMVIGWCVGAAFMTLFYKFSPWRRRAMEKQKREQAARQA